MAAKKADLAILFGGKPGKGGGDEPEADEDMGPGAIEMIQTALDSGSAEDWKAAIQACQSEDYDE